MAENKTNKAIAGIGSMVDNMGKTVAGAGGIFTKFSEAVAGAGEAAQMLGVDLSSVLPGLGGVMKACSEMGGVMQSLGGGISSAGEMLNGFAEKLGGLSAVSEGAFGPILEKIAGMTSGFLSLLGIGAGLGIVVAGLGLLHQAYGEEMDALIEMMLVKGPEIIASLCNGIITALPMLMEQGALLLNSLMEALIVNLPILLQGGFAIISGLITGIAAQLPLLIPTAVLLVLTLIQGLIDNIPQLVSSGLTLIAGLAQGLMAAIPVLIAAAPALIQSLLGGLLNMIPQIILTGVQLIGQLAVGLVQAIPRIVESIPLIIEAMKNAFKSVDWGQVGKDIIQGIKDGLGKAAHMLADAAKKAAKDALNWVKDTLGINSPSRVFRDEVGRMMALGMGIGFEANVPVRQMKKGVGQALKSLQAQADAAMSTAGTGVSYISSGSIGNAGAAGFDFDEFERRQRRINSEKTERPVFLNGRQVNRALKKGVPVTV